MCQGAFQVKTSGSDLDGTAQQCRLWALKQITNEDFGVSLNHKSMRHQKKKKLSQHCWHLTHKQNSVMAQQRWRWWLSWNTTAFASSLTLAAGETDSVGLNEEFPSPLAASSSARQERAVRHPSRSPLWASPAFTAFIPHHSRSQPPNCITPGHTFLSR